MTVALAARITPSPLVPGSEAARMLNDIWSWRRELWTGDELPDPANMPVVFEHLHARAGVRIRIASNQGRGRVLDLLGPQLSPLAHLMPIDDQIVIATVAAGPVDGVSVEARWGEGLDGVTFRSVGMYAVCADLPLDVLVAGASEPEHGPHT